MQTNIDKCRRLVYYRVLQHNIIIIIAMLL